MTTQDDNEKLLSEIRETVANIAVEAATALAADQISSTDRADLTVVLEVALDFCESAYKSNEEKTK